MADLTESVLGRREGGGEAHARLLTSPSIIWKGRKESKKGIKEEEREREKEGNEGKDGPRQRIT